MHPFHRSGLRLCGALIAALLFTALPASGAQVASLSGEVEIGRGQPPRWTPLDAGDELAAGDRVRTGDDGRAEIRLARATVRLYPNSLLRIPDEQAEPTGDGDAVELEGGRSLFDVLRGEQPFEVRTPEVVVSVKGTRFSVALDGDFAAVAVFRGAVGVKSLALEAAREVLVREGFVASGNESFELRALDLRDPWDDFSGDVLPDVPRPQVEQPSDASLEQTRGVALEQARSLAVERAAERHPNVQGRVESLRGERAAAQRGLVDGAAAATGDVTATAVPGLDAVADAPARLADELESNGVELWLNGGATGNGPFGVTLLPSGGSGADQVLIEVVNGASWTLDQALVEDVLGGAQSLPQDLITELDNQGISDPAAFAQQLLGLFR